MKFEFVGFRPLKVQATSLIIIFSLMCFAWLEGTKAQGQSKLLFWQHSCRHPVSQLHYYCTSEWSTAAFWFSLYTFFVYNEHSLIYVAMCLDNVCNVSNRPYSVKMNSGIFAAMATIVPCM